MEGDDFLSEPYSFGECRSYDFTTTAHCKAFETPDKEIHVSVRKRGDWVTVIIPDIISMNGGTEDDIITIDPFLPAELLGSKPRVRLFGGLANSVPNPDKIAKTLPTIIRLEIDGSIKIRPAAKFTNTSGTIYYTDRFLRRIELTGGTFTKTKEGSLATQFTYVIDDGHNFSNAIY